MAKSFVCGGIDYLWYLHLNYLFSLFLLLLMELNTQSVSFLSLIAPFSPSLLNVVSVEFYIISAN